MISVDESNLPKSFQIANQGYATQSHDVKIRASKEKVNPKMRAKKPSSKASIDQVRYQEVINTYATVHSKHNSIIAGVKERNRNF